MTNEQIAAEAASLSANQVFQMALDAMRSDALEALARIDAICVNSIRDQQAKVRVVDELRGSLDAFIRRGQPAKKPGIV